MSGGREGRGQFPSSLCNYFVEQFIKLLHVNISHCTRQSSKLKSSIFNEVISVEVKVICRCDILQLAKAIMEHTK